LRRRTDDGTGRSSGRFRDPSIRAGIRRQATSRCSWTRALPLLTLAV